MTAPNPSIPTNAAPTMRQILEPIYRIYHSMGRCPDFHSFASRYSPGSEAASLRSVLRLRALDHAPSDFRLTLVFLATLPSLRSEEHTSELQSLRHLVCR